LSIFICDQLSLSLSLLLLEKVIRIRSKREREAKQMGKIPKKGVILR